MSEHGYFAVDRRLFDHPIFANEPFTEREAWLWLIKEAAWRPYRVRRSRRLFDLDRGQLVHALRFMAVRWRWSEPRVRRFLSKLQTDAMLTLQPTRDATLITICNYDEHQPGRLTDVTTANEENEPTGDALATHSRRKPEALKHLNIKTEKKGKPDAGVPQKELEAVLDSERAQAVVDHRRKLRKPLTARAAKLLAASFAKTTDPNASADAMIANGWQGFDPSWLANRQPRANGPPNGLGNGDVFDKWIQEGSGGESGQNSSHDDAQLVSAAGGKH